jgi:hypothetical protein
MTRITRTAVAAVTVGLALPLLAVTSPVSAAQPAPCTPNYEGNDLDGDGVADLFFGVPDRTVNGQAAAGAVVVQGSKGTVVLTRESLGLGQPRAGDRFGQAVRVHRIANDCARLVVTAPGLGGRGALVVIPGSSAGVGQGTPTFAAAPALAQGDRFGHALGTVSPDGYLNVGAPGTDVGRKKNAGAVHRVRLSDESGIAVAPTFAAPWTQNSPGTPDRAETGDRFGEVLAGTRLVGVPCEDIGRKRNAGIVMERTGDNDVSRLRQGRRGIKGTAEQGDRFGAALSVAWDNVPARTWMAIGAPGEDVGRVKDVGSVHIGVGRNWAVARPGKNGTGKAERGDAFGSAVITDVVFDADPWVHIGVPGEDVRGKRNAGAVVSLEVTTYGPASILDSVTTTQGGEAGDKPERGDRLGASFSFRMTTDTEAYNSTFWAGVPGEDVGGVQNAGGLLVVGSCVWNALPCGPLVTMTQLGTAPRAGDRLGTSSQLS